MDNGQLKIENARLPKGWEIKKLKEIANIKYGYTESASLDKIGPKFLRITDIQNGNVNWLNVPYCKINNDEINKYLLNTNSSICFISYSSTDKKWSTLSSFFISVFSNCCILESCDSWYFWKCTRWCKCNKTWRIINPHTTTPRTKTHCRHPQ